MFEILSETKDYAKELIEEYINIVKKIEVNDKIDKNIEIQNKKIQTAIKKKSKLLEYNIDNKITDNDFILMNKKCEEEILNAQNIIFELENEKSSVDKVKNNINEIRQILQNATEDAENNLIDKNFVDKYIDEILVTPIDETTMKLEIKIFTNQVLEKTITMSKFRMGHMSNIILPKRNIIFYRNIRTVDNHIKSFCYNVSISIDI